MGFSYHFFVDNNVERVIHVIRRVALSSVPYLIRIYFIMVTVEKLLCRNIPFIESNSFARKFDYFTITASTQSERKI